jgi:hypothetical protein
LLLGSDAYQRKSLLASVDNVVEAVFGVSLLYVVGALVEKTLEEEESCPFEPCDILVLWVLAEAKGANKSFLQF